MICGKTILNTIINEKFVVKQSDGTNASSDEKFKRVVKSLIEDTNESEWPGDFQEFKEFVLT